jgi:hypothetical protein
LRCKPHFQDRLYRETRGCLSGAEAEPCLWSTMFSSPPALHTIAAETPAAAWMLAWPAKMFAPLLSFKVLFPFLMPIMVPVSIAIGVVIITIRIRVVRVVIVRVGVVVGIVTVIRVKAPITRIRSAGGWKENQT